MNESAAIDRSPSLRGRIVKPRVVWSLLIKDWRCLRHDRHGLAALFIMPALFILIMSLVMQEAMSYDHQPQLPAIGIINQAPAALGHRQLAKRLQAELSGRVFTDQAALLTALQTADLAKFAGATASPDILITQAREAVQRVETARRAFAAATPTRP